MSSGPHRFPVNGCWLEFFDPLIAGLAGQAGYDCTMIDMEHGPERGVAAPAARASP